MRNKFLKLSKFTSEKCWPSWTITPLRLFGFDVNLTFSKSSMMTQSSHQFLYHFFYIIPNLKEFAKSLFFKFSKNNYYYYVGTMILDQKSLVPKLRYGIFNAWKWGNLMLVLRVIQFFNERVKFSWYCKNDSLTYKCLFLLYTFKEVYVNKKNIKSFHKPDFSFELLFLSTCYQIEYT